MPVSSTRHPILYRVAVAFHRCTRWVSWHADGKRYATSRTHADLANKACSHTSVLLRRLGNSDPRLQRNKIKNLEIAGRGIDKILIRPGETFSFWRLVGNPTTRKGYLPGMFLSNGEVSEGIGGGLCQMGNLLYWMALHTPLTVAERFRHSFDAFPDSGRVLPFGSGATLFYNYIDLQLRNETDTTFEIRVWVGETFLHGEIRTDALLPESYGVIERDHRFLRDRTSGSHFRENRICRKVMDRRTGVTVREELVCENRAEMKYPPPEGADIRLFDRDA